MMKLYEFTAYKIKLQILSQKKLRLYENTQLVDNFSLYLQHFLHDLRNICHGCQGTPVRNNILKFWNM
jgi:hypothetical protein